MRGEDLGYFGSCLALAETPPRAWGRRCGQCHCFSLYRNTPTCVGKTPKDRSPSASKKKHPHVRGEDRLHGDDTRHSMETPPRAWGRPSWHNSNRTAIGKHPHVRGEDACRLCLRCGLSGNTPTCVGKTLRDYSLFLLSRQNNIETSSFSDTSCSPDNSMSWRFGSPMP